MTAIFRLNKFRFFFRPILYRFNGGIMRLSLGEKTLCVRVFEGEGDLKTSY